MNIKLAWCAALLLLAAMFILQPWVSPVPETAEEDFLVSELETQPPESELAAPMSQVDSSGLTRMEIGNAWRGATPAECTATLCVTVVGGTNGKPFLNIDVGILPRDGSSVDQVFAVGRTDATGSWNISVPPGEQRVSLALSLNGNGWDFEKTEIFQFVDGEINDYVIKVPDLYHYTLRIQDLDGNPLVGKEVRASAGGEKGFHIFPIYETDENGEVDAIFLGRSLYLDVLECPPGYIPFRVWLDLEPKHDGESQILELYPGRELQVLVQDEEQQPIENAAIGLDFPRHELQKRIDHGVMIPMEISSSKELLTDGLGVIVLQIPICEPAQITAQHPLFVMETATLSLEQTETALTLSAGSALSGRVLDGDRKAVMGAEVQVWSDGKSGSGRRTDSDWKKATTDNEGAFQLHGIQSSGGCRLLVKADGFTYDYQQWTSSPIDILEIVLTPADSLFGFVVDVDGNRIANAKVELHDSGKPRRNSRHWISGLAGTVVQTTGEDGSFQFPGLAFGEFQLRISGVPETAIQVHTGPEPVSITLGQLSPGFRIVDFEVLDAETREPVRRPDVDLFEISEGGQPDDIMNLREGKDGRYRSKPFLRYNAFFAIQARGYVSRGIPVSSLSDGMNKQTIYLQKAAVSRLISFAASDGLPVIPEGGTIGLGAAVILEDEFLMAAHSRNLLPLPKAGIGLGSSFKASDGSFSFRSFPVHDAVLRLETSPLSEIYLQNRLGPTIELQVPAGSGRITLTLSMEELRALGLRE